MANVRLVELTKNYKRGSEIIRALDGVTLDIDKGEFVAVVGRSGSGKTTMLDLLGLLLKPTAGSLFIDDVDTTKLGDRQRAQMRARRVGFVFQEYNLLSGMNLLNREDQVTIVIVTHDVDIASQTRRQIRLKDGKVLTDERVEEKVPVA